ncbi:MULTISPECIES: AAA family ATPase [unclassified Streptomyces]|uniref:AAA family ATPase n=1 Tax=unclassified Streptomyces TaxID=2593676 RepID=UPI0033B16B1E
MRSLTEIRVKNLLGRFNHVIKFPEDDEFVILHGPNGVGKTKVLELIRALAAPLQLHRIARIPFGSAELLYSDGSILQVSRNHQESLPLGDGFEKKVRQVSLTLTFPGARDSVRWSASFDNGGLNSPRLREYVSRMLEIDQVAPDVWEDATGTTMTTSELLDIYGERLPSSFLRTTQEKKIPAALRNFIMSNDVHLIETQRLLGLQNLSGPNTRRVGSIKVEEFAKDLSRRLAEALAENSRVSQELDRTYPTRLLKAQSEYPDEQRIGARYDEQNRLRRRLAEISLLDEKSGGIVIPEGMAAWQRNVLWTYLEDSDKKLSTFRYILDRVSLLQEIVNSRFLYKRLEVDRKRGLRIVTDEGTDLSLSMLSSGEQHELVLLYDLLFNVGPGALVLIDEPEISLHVSWQKRFIDDLRRISALVQFRSIVATHSPQIAGKWIDRMTSLAPESD